MNTSLNSVCLIPVLLILLSINLISCDDDGAKKITINGNVENATAEVTATVNGREVDRTATNSNGDFQIIVPNGFNDVLLRFVTLDFEVARIFKTTPDSKVNLVVSIEPDLITIIGWQILQGRIKLSGSDTFLFEETEVDFSINGRSNDCIRTKSDSFFEITVKSVTLANCGVGVRTEGTSDVIFQTDEDINLTARSDGIRSRNDSFVRLTADNSIFVSSDRENGIRAQETSVVRVEPTNTCTIFGANKAINAGSNATIDPDGCTLVDG
ncbi:hypothetical protein MYX76_12160 [Desulfobacterota bacterium AH_259_B03_O07]|nr:hypothetical protein [Desulfobacterota bacterium AH_259_B03_O07]